MRFNAGVQSCDTDPTQPIGIGRKHGRWPRLALALRPAFTIYGTPDVRMLEAGVPFQVVSNIMGWSPSTAIRMAKRHGHIGDKARRDAIEKLGAATSWDREGAQKWAQSQVAESVRVQ